MGTSIKSSYIHIVLFLIPIIIVLRLFSFIVSDGGTQKYMDFVPFYAGAAAYMGGERENIYDLEVQEKWANHTTKNRSINDDLYPYFLPPFMFIVLVPLVPLGLEGAYTAWILVNLTILLILSVFINFLFLNKFITKIAALFITLTFIPIIFSIAIAQFAIIISFILFTAWYLFRNKRSFESGLILSLLLIKPYLVILPFLALSIQGQKQVLKGLVVGGIFLGIASLLLVGPGGILGYIGLLWSAAGWNQEYGIYAYAQYNIQTLLMFIFNSALPDGVRIYWASASIIIVSILMLVWARKTKPESQESKIQWLLLILATILTSLHTHYYDLSFLAISNLILLEGMEKSNPRFKKWSILTVALIYLWLFLGTISFTLYGWISQKLLIEITISLMMIIFAFWSFYFLARKESVKG